MNTDWYWPRKDVGKDVRRGRIYPHQWRSPLGLVQVRRATLGDLTPLAQILSQGFHSDRLRQQWFYPMMFWGLKTELKQRLTSPEPYHICLVAETAGQIHGTVELGTRPLIPWQPLAPETPRSSPYYLYLSNLAVVEYSRRQGIATHLIQACESISQTWGFTGLYLHVLKSNQMACDLYCRAGYQIIQEEAPWEAWLLGRPPCLFLHKAL